MFEFILFGIKWDMRPIVGMVWAFIGMMCIGLTFWIDTMPGWAIALWLIVTFVFIATAESITKRLTDGDG